MTAYPARFGPDRIDMSDISHMRRPKGHFALSVRSLCRIQLIVYGRHSGTDFMIGSKLNECSSPEELAAIYVRKITRNNGLDPHPGQLKCVSGKRHELVGVAWMLVFQDRNAGLANLISRTIRLSLIGHLNSAVVTMESSPVHHTIGSVPR